MTRDPRSDAGRRGWLERYAERRLRRAALAAGFPGLSLEPLAARLRAGVAERGGAAAGGLAAARAVRRLHLEDLCLAAACAAGDERAWARLQERYGAHVRRVARRFFGPMEAHEVADGVWAHLYLEPRGRTGTPRIATYDGRGALETWLRGVVANLALQRHKRQRREVPLEAEDERTVPPSAIDRSGLSPAVAAAVRRALAAAVDRLGTRDRFVLFLHYYRDCSLEQIGRAIGRDKSNVSRRLNKLLARLQARVAADLRGAGIALDRHLAAALVEAVPASLQRELRRRLDPDATANATRSGDEHPPRRGGTRGHRPRGRPGPRGGRTHV